VSDENSTSIVFEGMGWGGWAGKDIDTTSHDVAWYTHLDHRAVLCVRSSWYNMMGAVHQVNGNEDM